MNFYFGSNLLPGQSQSEYLTQEAQITWGKWFHMQQAMGLVDKDTVDAGNSTTTILRPGLALGIIYATGQITHWNPYATDGSHRLFGFFGGMSQSMSLLGSGTSERWVGDILVQGNIKSGSIVIPGEAAAGIAGKTYEFLLREQLVGRFITDDEASAGYSVVKEQTVAAATTAATLTLKDHNTIFVTDTALGADCTLTLPAPVPGLKFGFVHTSTTAATELILEGPATEEFWVGGAVANEIRLAGDNATGLRWLRACRVTDTTVDLYKYVLDGPAA